MATNPSIEAIKEGLYQGACQPCLAAGDVHEAVYVISSKVKDEEGHPVNEIFLCESHSYGMWDVEMGSLAE